MRILGIETSCDDTGIAIYDDIHGIICNEVYSQSELYNEYGGIVPELASRKHLDVLAESIWSLFNKYDISKNSISAIAYTAGPGLAGSLLIGASVSTALAFSLNIPVILVNHMEGHLLAPMLEINKPNFPFLGLLVSGGHTQLINAVRIGKYYLLGESLDDAVGEAFDKVAKLLGLSYPGGSSLSELAKKGKSGVYKFPRPMVNHPGLNFSFSGLKTFVANVINNESNDIQTKANIAKEFELSVIDSLAIKCQRALKKFRYKSLVVSGGVSKNKILRKKINEIANQHNCNVFYSKFEYCTDNGAMIAYVGSVRFEKFKSFDLEISINPTWSIVDLDEI